MGEIDMALNGLGKYAFKPDQIIYASCLKMDSHVKFADECGIGLTVADSEEELKKLARLGSKMAVLIRINVDDKNAPMCGFSKKFGAKTTDAPQLLELAKNLGTQVKGVCFHVGSPCGNAQDYVDAIRDARYVFDAAKSLKMPDLKILDLGGGFPGSDE